jgi:hypothetical protein
MLLHIVIAILKATMSVQISHMNMCMGMLAILMGWVLFQMKG